MKRLYVTTMHEIEGKQTEIYILESNDHLNLGDGLCNGNYHQNILWNWKSETKGLNV